MTDHDGAGGVAPSTPAVSWLSDEQRGLLAVAEAEGWPRAQYGPHALDSADAWRALAARATAPAEQRRLLALALGLDVGAPWLAAPLVATAAARQRLRDWYSAGATAPSADDLVRNLAFIGCEEARTLTLDALLGIAPPAGDYLLKTALFASVGWTARGWCMRVALPAAARVVILLDGSERDPIGFRDLVLHESAHGWLEPDPAELPSPAHAANLTGAALLGAAQNPERMRAYLERSDDREHRADALALAWGARPMENAAPGREAWQADARRLTAMYG